MDNFKHYTEADIGQLFTVRAGETRLGQVIKTVGSLEELASLDARFVMIGIPEDIGIRANFGLGGSSSLWKPFLRAFLSVQSNDMLSGDQVAVLGAFNCQSGPVSALDDLIHPVIQQVVSAGKIPVVIGGGHNNAFPILKGMHLGLGRPMNTINIDAHADLRTTLEGRHSGNGFSAAIEAGHLQHYHPFGLHENYNNAHTLKTIAENPNIYPVFFDELLRSDIPSLEAWKTHTKDLPMPCGLEIDLDSIQGVLSSAMSPSGFTLNEVRQMVLNLQQPIFYLHICEGAVEMADGRKDLLTAKAVCYLVTDFMKTQTNIRK